MKTKLSAIEELRLEKAKLAAECAEDKEKLLHNLNYAKSHTGRLLVNSLFSSTKSGVSDVVSLVSGKNKGSKPSSGIIQAAVSIAPFIWELVQPMLISMAVKKVKSAFTKKTTKKKKVKS